MWEEGRERERNTAVDPEKHTETCFWLLAPSSCDLGQDYMKPTHLRGTKKLQGFPEPTHAATDVEGLEGEQGDG